MKWPWLAKVRPHGSGVKLTDPAFRRRKKIHKWVWLGLAMLVLILASWWFIQDQFLSIKTVTVIEQVSVTPSVVPLANVKKDANTWRGQWMWVNTDRLEVDLLKRYPSLSTVSIQRHWPDSLELTFLPRVPLCQLITPSGVYLVDRGGMVFARLPQPVTTLPSLRASFQPTVGQPVSTTGVRLGLQLVTGLRSVQPMVTGVNLHDDQLDIQLSGPPLILVDAQASAEEVILQIQTMLARFASESRYPNQVDMRFDRPVLKY